MTDITESIRRMQKLSGILLEDDAFNSGRPNNGNHDDAHWAAKEGSGQYSAGPAVDILQYYEPSEGLLMYTDESQNTAVIVADYTSFDQFAEDMRKLVGDRVFSAYVDEPGVFDVIEDPDQVDGDCFVETMTIKEVARLLNRWAARNKVQGMQRFDKTDMRAKP